MSVELWYGRWPETRHEQNALIEIYQFLKVQSDHFLLLVQFHPPDGNEIDWVVIKSNGIFVAELKDAADKLVGGVEGDWNIVRSDGSEASLRHNPFKQVKHNYWRFKTWCEKDRRKISQDVARQELPDYGQMRSFIVITPDLHPDSDIHISPPTEVMGLKKFMLAVMMLRFPRLELAPQEMARFPALLKLTPWHMEELGSPAEPASPPPVLEPGDTQAVSATWKPEPFAALVARGHGNSAPLLRLSDLLKTTYTIGRSIDNDLVVNHDTVSRHHARLQRTPQGFVIEDLKSKDGTYLSFFNKKKELVKERQLEPHSPSLITNYSQVRFGEVMYTFLQYE